MKRKLYIIIAMLLPTLLTAQEKVVQVPYSCGAGNAFTIKIPVRIPAGASGEYEWYKNDTLIAGTRTTLTAGVTAIAYTIPANEAYGDSMVFYFKYNVYENGCSDCGEWTASPKYIVTFLTPSSPCTITIGGIAGSNVVTESVAYPACTITIGGIAGSDVVTEPVPHDLAS